MNQSWTPAGTEPLIDRLRRAVIGRYDVYAELGQGGMASVYLALDLALDRKVAIKVMSPALMGSHDNVERFKREAKVAAALNHPHIIGILAVGDDPELAFFVMKFVEGRSLDSVIRDEGPQTVPFVQSVIASAGKALHYAHTRGVIHRDVKPANFMLDQDGWLVVTDFGIAKQGEAKGLTVTGSLIGTPYYMSPEQYHGKPVSPAADQYALGIVAYELLTGTQPYTGDTVAEVMRGHLFDEVPDVRALRSEVPAEIAACISRMLAKEPEHRYATLEQAVLAFGAISATQEVQVRTQIIELAKTGVMKQPQINVPLSPIPSARTKPAGTPPPRTGQSEGAVAAQLAATTPVPGLRPTRPGVGPVPELIETRSAPAKSKLPLVAALMLVVGVVGATAVLKPELLGLGGGSTVAATEPALDSTAVRDALERVRNAEAARTDSLVRLATLAAADSIARADSLVHAVLATRDSITRADSIRRAAQTPPAPVRRVTPPTRPAVRAGAAAALRARKDGRRTTVPPRNP